MTRVEFFYEQNIAAFRTFVELRSAALNALECWGLNTSHDLLMAWLEGAWRDFVCIKTDDSDLPGVNEVRELASRFFTFENPRQWLG